MLRKVWRRLDKLHLLLFIACFLLGASMLSDQRAQSNVEVNVYEAGQPIKNYSLKNLVSYDKNVPLLWIGGVPRSGTTLIRAMLDAHPYIRCGEETRVIPRILGMHTKTVASQTEMSRLEEAHISESLLRDALASYLLTIIAGHGEAAPLLCNKDPFAIRSMSHIRQMFPKSKVILMIRDGRSVAHSIISRHITIKGFDMKSYEGTLKDWNRAISSMWEGCKASGPSVCLPVYYERLVIDPKSQMQRIIEFLGVPWDDIVLHHEDTIGVKGGISLSKKEPSTDQVNKAVNLEALSKWFGAIPSNALQTLDRTAPMLAKFGYDVHQYPPDYTKLLNPLAEKTMSI
ncbi:protein-tyrosine sulfotransferase 1-like [Watersipora subatra]|uniref:protein-tyrosine sulfotransferase 1-like n=1 Tax=Watersipora subatra TaxID=2589382 RepID=UPI00355B78B2